ncbi:MAG: DUF4191 domain-containing protein [Actinobacteria bacterium]|nr:DUF4191 domain-containing protein [Actinomycetota bacterium]MBW3646265.1 DUF4191 domain-containing protein [Actinomycetota bacterium]
MALRNRSKDAPAGKGPGVKGGKGTAPAKKKLPRGARLQQIKRAFAVTRQNDPKVLPYLLAAFFGPFLLLLALGFVVGQPIYLGFLGLLVALIVTAFVFGRRVQATAYSQVEGQLGAAAAVLDNMRGDWRVTPAVGFTREQDLLHRVIGLPGVVLVAEGARNRTRNLVVTEKKRLARWIGDVPVYEVLVGDGEGQVGLRELEKHFLKLPRNIKGKQVNELDRKLKAMGGAGAMPIPKGPMPTRMPRK